MPDADAIIVGGSQFCGELLGTLRVELLDLRPTPTQALDNPVDGWIAIAESIAFECPDDEAVLAERFHSLDVFAAEVDAGLNADQGG